MTDQPGNVSDFEACVVTITGVRVEPAPEDGAGEEATDGEVHEDAEESSGVDDVGADLVELLGGNTQLVEEHELRVGEYECLKLAVSNVEATLEDGGDADVTTPGGARPKFDESFEIREGQRTVSTADFTPGRQGQSGGYVPQPVADGTRVDYEDGGEEGAHCPRACAVVHAPASLAAGSSTDSGHLQDQRGPQASRHGGGQDARLPPVRGVHVLRLRSSWDRLERATRRSAAGSTAPAIRRT